MVKEWKRNESKQSYSARNTVRKSDGKDSMNDDMSSILRDLSSCFKLFFSSADIPLPSADLLLSLDKFKKLFYKYLIRNMLVGSAYTLTNLNHRQMHGSSFNVNR